MINQDEIILKITPLFLIHCHVITTTLILHNFRTLMKDEIEIYFEIHTDCQYDNK